MRLDSEVLGYGEAIARLVQEDHLRKFDRPSRWPDRLAAYEWRGATLTATNEKLTRLADRVHPIVSRIAQSHELDTDTLTKLRNFATEVFVWGGVTTGASKKNLSGREVCDVVHAAITWSSPSKGVPMDSGWTKVAAIASGCLEPEGRLPQVIFDSRVSASLLSRMDEVLKREGRNPAQRPKEYLPEQIRDLGRASLGRGVFNPNGGQRRRYLWPDRYRQWKGQFAASALVGAIREALNADLDRYGRMPTSPNSDGAWTVRGVEMVLFMEGYLVQRELAC